MMTFGLPRLATVRALTGWPLRVSSGSAGRCDRYKRRHKDRADRRIDPRR